MKLDFIREMGKELDAAGIKTPEDMEEALVDSIEELGLDVDGLDVEFADGKATVFGTTADDDTREKVLVAIGNHAGVFEVTDSMEVGTTEVEAAAVAAAEDAEKAAERAAQVAELRAKIEAARAAKQEDEAIELERQQKRLRRKQLRAARAVRRQRAKERKERKASKTVFYTVASGDTLWKIADAHYGDGSKFPAIFEANRPMLKSADLIYPGQMLRIPPAQ